MSGLWPASLSSGNTDCPAPVKGTLQLDKPGQIGIYSYHLNLSRGVSWDAMRRGIGAAPAGGARNPALGTLRAGRPTLLRGSAGRPAGRGLDEGGRKSAGSGCARRILSRPGRTAPECEIAEQSSLRRLRKLVCDVERREAGDPRHGSRALRAACVRQNA